MSIDYLKVIAGGTTEDVYKAGFISQPSAYGRSSQPVLVIPKVVCYKPAGTKIVMSAFSSMDPDSNRI